MWSPQCLLLLFQALVPVLAGCFERHPEHEHAQKDPVFLDDSTALRFLGRKPLFNHWDFELIVPDNLERECKEEVCNYEEAREVFEDDILTAEYGDRPWAGLEDGYLHTAKRKKKKKNKDFWERYIHNGKGGKRASGVDVAGLVAGLVAALVSAIMIAIVAMYCFRYRAKERRRSRSQENSSGRTLHGISGEEPKPESAPGLPTYEQALVASGMHDAPPPPYERNSINLVPVT